MDLVDTQIVLGIYLLLHLKLAQGVLFLENALKFFQVFLTSQYTWIKNKNIIRRTMKKPQVEVITKT